MSNPDQFIHDFCLELFGHHDKNTTEYIKLVASKAQTYE